MFEFIWSMVGVLFGLAMIYLIIKSMAWSPVAFQALGQIKDDPAKDEMTRNIATALWLIAGLWYLFTIIVFFFGGLWVLIGLLSMARDWWHASPK